MDVAKLQRVQNYLPRVVTQSPRFFSLSAASKIIALATCALSHYFQDSDSYAQPVVTLFTFLG